MIYFVKTLKGNTYPIDCEASDTVYMVKEKLYTESGIPVSEQKLIYSGFELENSKTLEEIKGAMTLIRQLNMQNTRVASEAPSAKPSHALSRASGSSSSSSKTKKDLEKPRQFIIATLSGKTYTVDVEASDTIYMVKEKLYTQSGIPIPEQKLLHAGSELENSKTLEEIKFDHLTTTFLVRRLNMQNTRVASEVPSSSAKPSDALSRASGSSSSSSSSSKTKKELEKPLQFTVTASSGDKYTIDFEASDTVYMVKEKLYTKYGIPVSEQKLVFAGLELKNSNTLKEIKFAGHGPMFLVRQLNMQNTRVASEASSSSDKPWQFTVTTTRGDAYTIDFEPSDTVYTVKEKLYTKYGIPVSEQTLLYGSSVLRNDSKLEEYPFLSRDALRLVQRPNRQNTNIASVASSAESSYSLASAKASFVDPVVNRKTKKDVDTALEYYFDHTRSSPAAFNPVFCQSIANHRRPMRLACALLKFKPTVENRALLDDLNSLENPMQYKPQVSEDASRKQNIPDSLAASLVSVNSSSSQPAFFQPAPAASQELPMHSRKFNDLPLEFRNYLASQASEVSQRSGGKPISAEDYWKQSETLAEKSKFALVEDYEQEHPERRQTFR